MEVEVPRQGVPTFSGSHTTDFEMHGSRIDPDSSIFKIGNKCYCKYSICLLEHRSSYVVVSMGTTKYDDRFSNRNFSNI